MNTEQSLKIAESAAYEGMPGELMWQTSGAPHQLQLAPTPKQPASGGVRKKEGGVRRRKDPFLTAPSEQASSAGKRCALDPPHQGRNSSLASDTLTLSCNCVRTSPAIAFVHRLMFGGRESLATCFAFLPSFLPSFMHSLMNSSMCSC